MAAATLKAWAISRVCLVIQAMAGRRRRRPEEGRPSRMVRPAAVLIGATVLAAIPCVQLALAQGPEITIGVAADTSGPASSIGWRQVNAAQLAVDQTNAAGGVEVAGTVYTLVLVSSDDGCSGAEAPSAANSLLNAGAVGVVGHTCSGATGAAQPVYHGAGVAMITPSSSAPFLTEQGYDNTFRVIARDDAPADLMATYFRQWLGLERVAIIRLTEPGVDTRTDRFAASFTGLGGTITGTHAVASAAEFGSALSAADAAGAQGLFYADGDAGRAGAFSSAAHGVGFATVGWDSMESDTAAYAAAAGPAAAGDYVGIYGRTPAEMPGYAAFASAYQAAGFAQFGDDPEAWGALAYDATRMLIAAIDRAAGVDATAVKEALAATSYHRGVVGIYRGFDAKGDSIPQWASLRHYQGGEWRSLSPSRVCLPLTLTQDR